MLFPPEFEREAESVEGVKLRDDDNAPLSRRLHHVVDLRLAVRLFMVDCSKSAMQSDIILVEGLVNQSYFESLLGKLLR